MDRQVSKSSVLPKADLSRFCPPGFAPMIHGTTGGNAVAEKRVDFTYDALSRFDTISRYADLAGTQLAVQTGYTFDNAGRLTDLVQKGATTLADYDYTYDVASRLTQMVSLADGTSTYSYDVLDQVTGATHTYQTDESYSYDDNGNRTNTGYNTTANNRLQSDGTYDYQYDQEGNRTKKLLAGTTTVVAEYTWDHRNRLVQVTQYDTASALVTSTVEYGYDVYNRLVSRSVTSGGSTTTGHFVYDGNQIVLVLDDTAAVENRYLWGPMVDQVLADEDAATGDVLWPLADHLGTVRDLASYDSQQDLTTVANHRVFDSFGNLTSETNPAVDHLFEFTGRYVDPVTGLQWNLNRWYDAAVGRWMSEDPIGFVGGDANLHRYVGNSPAMYRDPLGLASTGSEEEWWNDSRWDWASLGAYPGIRHAINYFTGYNDANDRSHELDIQRAANNPNRPLRAGDFPTALTGQSQAVAAAKAQSEINQFGRDRIADIGYEVAGAGFGGIIGKADDVGDLARAGKTARPSGLGRFPEWKVGECITKVTPEGNYPSWATIRSRYWQNRVAADAASFGATNRAIMEKGFAPKARVIVRDRDTGRIYERLVEKELHHARGNRGVPGYDCPPDLREVWPWEHENLVPPGRRLDYDFIRFK